ncbi:MAG: FAD-dependent monooxygenase [Henriciella sp.]
MSNSENSYDVLIVGCGPTGATLANLLRMSGRRVAIFDRDADVFHAPRAMVIDAESCRIYQRMGILDRLTKEDAAPFLKHKFVAPNRKTLVAFDLEIIPETFGQPASGMMFHQPALERMLREDFSKAPTVDAYLGHEVLSVESHDERAVVKARNVETGEEAEYEASYIVGSDGGVSLCRRSIGANRIDLEYRRKWIVIDVILQDRDYWDSIREGSEFKCQPDSAVVFVKGHHGHLRFDFEIEEERADSFSKEDAIALISDFVDPSSAEIIRLTPYNFYAGMPDRWRKDRILLAGDAAHQTSPFAGQGLNMGIRDAAHLAFLFDLIFDGKADDSILDSYQEERWDHCRVLIDVASERGKMISLTGLGARFRRNTIFAFARHFPPFRRAMTLARSDYPLYTGGLIGTGHALCGARLIQPWIVDAEGVRTKLDDVIGDGFSLLTSTSVSGPAIDWFENEFGGRIFRVGEDFTDPEGKLTEVLDGHSILVRPDRFIYGASTQPNELCAAFHDHLSKYHTSHSTEDAPSSTEQSLASSVTG